jgi:hypothetical protein
MASRQKHKAMKRPRSWHHKAPHSLRTDAGLRKLERELRRAWVER